jgi:hypothetical protein
MTVCRTFILKQAAEKLRPVGGLSQQSNPSRWIFESNFRAEAISRIKVARSMG